MKQVLRQNGLSIVLTLLFLALLVGHAWAGWQTGNEARRHDGRPELAWGPYLRTGEFWESVFENWESEFLQMGAYVILTSWLYQKGSAESNDPDQPKPDTSANQRSPEISSWKRWLFEHSLSLSLFGLFALSFAGHVVHGARSLKEKQSATAVSWYSYLGSAQFWFESLQNWQSEFLAVLCLVVLSIWFREKNSPESKRLEDPAGKTGK